jgi:hypothetical protein
VVGGMFLRAAGILIRMHDGTGRHHEDGKQHENARRFQDSGHGSGDMIAARAACQGHGRSECPRWELGTAGGFTDLQVHPSKKRTGPFSVRWRNLSIRED